MFLSEPLTIWDLLAGTDKERPGCSKTPPDRAKSEAKYGGHGSSKLRRFSPPAQFLLYA